MGGVEPAAYNTAFIACTVASIGCGKVCAAAFLTRYFVEGAPLADAVLLLIGWRLQLL